MKKKKLLKVKCENCGFGFFLLKKGWEWAMKPALHCPICMHSEYLRITRWGK